VFGFLEIGVRDGCRRIQLQALGAPNDARDGREIKLDARTARRTIRRMHGHGMGYRKDSLFGRPSTKGERGGPPFAKRTTDHFDQELRELPSLHGNSRPIDPARRTRIAPHILILRSVWHP
jgi:hypothetical protein